MVEGVVCLKVLFLLGVLLLVACSVELSSPRLIPTEDAEIHPSQGMQGSCPSPLLQIENTCPPEKVEWKKYRLEESPSNHVTGGGLSIDRQKNRVLLSATDATTSSVAGTGSMLPIINQYTEVVMIPATVDNVQVGDMAIYNYGGWGNLPKKRILHRVVGINPDGGYIFRGDNNPNNDTEPVYIDQLEGVVVAVVY